MWPVHDSCRMARGVRLREVRSGVHRIKAGSYGFIWFFPLIAPDAAQAVAPLIIGLSLIAVIYTGLCRIGTDGYEKVSGLFIYLTYGICDIGLFYI